MTFGGKGAPSVVPVNILDYQKDDSKKTVWNDNRDNINSLFYMKNHCEDFEKHEIWRSVTGYEGLYEVSNFGRVRSLDRYVKHGRYNDTSLALKKGRILSEKDNGHGYKIVHLTINRQTKDFYVHRLVAIAFLENKNNLPEVNHIDENRNNNCLDNLEWCTSKYNSNYGNHIKTLCVPVVMYDYKGNYIDEFISIAEAERLTGARGISSVCKGRRKTAGGYIWKYKESINESENKPDSFLFE